MRVALLLVVALCTAACGDDAPAAVAGDYTLSLTNHENGCAFQSWQEGDTTTGVPFTITQSGSSATGTIGGAAGVYVEVLLGSKAFIGSVSGDALHLVLHGTRAFNEGACTYTVTGTADATLAQDVLQGSIVYTTATNGSPDCAALASCHATQVFNGTRPPQ
ncbi:MAG TPA: hypothetical protein VGQ83_04475 [Polyangia bacterium]|jgi:hypothetical protein